MPDYKKAFRIVDDEAEASDDSGDEDYDFEENSQDRAFIAPEDDDSNDEDTNNDEDVDNSEELKANVIRDDNESQQSVSPPVYRRLKRKAARVIESSDETSSDEEDEPRAVSNDEQRKLDSSLESTAKPTNPVINPYKKRITPSQGHTEHVKLSADMLAKIERNRQMALMKLASKKQVIIKN